MLVVSIILDDIIFINYHLRTKNLEIRYVGLEKYMYSVYNMYSVVCTYVQYVQNVYCMNVQ